MANSPLASTIYLEQTPRSYNDYHIHRRCLYSKTSQLPYYFPLDMKYLPKVRLSAYEFERLRAKVESRAFAAFQGGLTFNQDPITSTTPNAKQWKQYVHKDNMIVTMRTTEAKDIPSTKNCTWYLRARIDTTLDELMYGLMTETTEEFRAFASHVYGESFLDAAVLQVHSTPTSVDPFAYVAIKWIALQTSNDTNQGFQDRYFIELCKSYYDENGNRILARLHQTISLKQGRLLQDHDFNFKRLETNIMQLFRTSSSNSNQVELAISGKQQLHKDFMKPIFRQSTIAQALMNEIMVYTTIGDAKYIVKNQLIQENYNWIHNDARWACLICLKKFGFKRSRHHCRLCGDIMCEQCLVTISMLLKDLPQNGKVLSSRKRYEKCITGPIKFCMRCIYESRQARHNEVRPVKEEKTLNEELSDHRNHYYDSLSSEMLTRTSESSQSSSNSSGLILSEWDTANTSSLRIKKAQKQNYENLHREGQMIIKTNSSSTREDARPYSASRKTDLEIVYERECGRHQKDKLTSVEYMMDTMSVDTKVGHVRQKSMEYTDLTKKVKENIALQQELMRMMFDPKSAATKQGH